MTRLVNDTRDKIIEAVITHRFRPEVDQMVARGATFAARIYDDVYSVDQRAIIESLPELWMPTDDDIQVKVGERTHRFAFNGQFSRHEKHFNLYRLATYGEMLYRRFPHKDHAQCVKVYEVRSKLGEALQTFLHDADALSAAIADARTKLHATVYEFYTVEKLIEAWPEVAPFIPEAQAPKPQLPALPTKALNKMFGLPVSV